MDVLTLEKRLAVVESKYSQCKDRIALLEANIADKESEKAILTKTLELFKFFLENKTKESREKLTKLLTFGLRTIFKDQTIDIEMEESLERGKPSLKLWLVHNGVKRPVIGSFGGGVVSVVSLIMRIITLVSLDFKRFVVLDEVCAHISDQYVPNVGELLKKLSESLGIDILMISHKPGFKDYADIVYHVDSNKDGSLKIVSVDSK